MPSITVLEVWWRLRMFVLWKVSENQRKLCSMVYEYIQQWRAWWVKRGAALVCGWRSKVKLRAMSNNWADIFQAQNCRHSSACSRRWQESRNIWRFSCEHWSRQDCRRRSNSRNVVVDCWMFVPRGRLRSLDGIVGEAPWQFDYDKWYDEILMESVSME